jgi:sulfane dehydrogenase subunit SoxC
VKHPKEDAAKGKETNLTARKLVGRRAVLRGALLSVGVAATGSGIARADDSIGTNAPEWMKVPGASFTPYGKPAKWEDKVERVFTILPGRAGTGSSRTPLQLLDGTITPSGLHFERHHNGVPDIDPAQHQLYIHGMVKQPLAYSVSALKRYPMESHIHFIECSGNSGGLNQPNPPQATTAEINGLLSGSEWTGVRLATLLREVGVGRGAKWVIAEGADSAAMSRSIPLKKCMDDAVIAMYQNGEAIRPEQGYPMRLGWHGLRPARFITTIQSRLGRLRQMGR